MHRPSVFTIASSHPCVTGETDYEIIDAMVDLKEAGVDILTFGQYLQPTPHHLPVAEYVTPEKFEHWCVLMVCQCLLPGLHWCSRGSEGLHWSSWWAVQLALLLGRVLVPSSSLAKVLAHAWRRAGPCRAFHCFLFYAEVFASQVI